MCIFFLGYFGIIRIQPLLEFFHKLIIFICPTAYERLSKNLYDSYPVEVIGNLPVKGIYLFHPHGLYSTAHMFHTASPFTNWPVRNIRGTAASFLWYVPFVKEIFEGKCVPVDYYKMKEVLGMGTSLGVTLGGINEMAEIKAGVMRLHIKKRNGIFKMAIQTGTPLVPVLVYGENELYEVFRMPFVDYIQKKMIENRMAFLVPSVQSVLNWSMIYNEPLKIPVKSVIGPSLDVGEAHEPTDEEIAALRNKYIAALRALYEKTRPAYYAEKMEIV